MNKTTKAICKICGEVEVKDFWQDEQSISVPTAIAPTIEDLGKYYEQFEGKTYEELTGNKIEESFTKEFIQPSHESIDDVGFEEAKKHILEPIECWVEDF